jgi:hypothetical protein
MRKFRSDVKRQNFVWLIVVQKLFLLLSDAELFGVSDGILLF